MTGPAPTKTLDTNWKVACETLGLRTPQVLGWNLDVA